MTAGAPLCLRHHPRTLTTHFSTVALPSVPVHVSFETHLADTIRRWPEAELCCAPEDRTEAQAILAAADDYLAMQIQTQTRSLKMPRMMISDQPIGCKGAAAIAETVLPTQSTLYHLMLSECCIGDCGVIALVAGLKVRLFA